MPTMTKTPTQLRPLESNRTRVLPSVTEPMASGFVDFIGGKPGKHALIGRARWWTPLRILVAVSGLFLTLGYLQKGQCVRTGHGQSGPFVDWSGHRQYTSACYNDTITLYHSHRLDEQVFPYLNSWTGSDGTVRHMEYPVLSGLFQWLNSVIAHFIYSLFKPLGMSAVPEASVYFAVNCFFLALAWMAAVAIMSRMTDNRVWDTLLMAASPLVIVHAFTNFDLLSVLPAVAAMALWFNRRPALSGVMIGLGISLKLWPAFIGGAIILLCLRNRSWLPLARMLSGMFITLAAINLPVYLLAPQGWGEFFRLNSQRGWEGSTIYAVIAHVTGQRAWDGNSPSTAVQGVGTFNLITFVLLAVCLVALAWLVVFKAPVTPRLGQVAFLALLAFMVTNKVWSPQYSIWLVPMLVLALPRWRLVFGWAALEAVYWYVRMWQFLPAGHRAPEWLADTMTVIRLGLLVFMAVVVIRQILGKDPDPVREAHRVGPQPEFPTREARPAEPQPDEPRLAEPQPDEARRATPHTTDTHPDGARPATAHQAMTDTRETE